MLRSDSRGDQARACEEELRVGDACSFWTLRQVTKQQLGNALNDQCFAQQRLAARVSVAAKR